MSKNQVLVIDDEKEICFLLSNMLKKIGFEVNSANSLSEGQELLREKQYQLVFLDLSLPDGLGFNFISHIRKVSEKIKVVIITAFEGNRERQRAQLEGAHYFVSKPFNKKRILEVIAQFDTAVT
ncbi:MAG: response regulator [Bacteroidota bacterium]